MILVDSSVWIDFFNGRDLAHVDCLDGLLGTEILAIGDLVLTEVLQGFRHDKDFKMARRIMEKLNLFEMVGQKIAIQSALNYRFLRKKDVTVRKTIDIIIGTFCIENSLILLHHDRDFTPMEKYLGLKVYSYQH